MRLLKEPLLHFRRAGRTDVCGLFRLRDRSAGSQPQPVIRMTAADAEWLKAMWTRQWRRPPTDEELTGLVADHLKEEVLAREARALELDVGDTIVRRRLAQKMAFLLDDTIRTTEPPEAELRALYETRSGSRPHASAGVLHAGLLPPRRWGRPRPGQPRGLVRCRCNS